MADVLRHVTNSEGLEEKRKTARLDVPIRVEYRIISSENRGDGAENKEQRTKCKVQSTEHRTQSPEDIAQNKIKGAVTKNVSAGGCLLLLTEELSIGVEVELRIFLGVTESEALTIKGRIARLNRQEKDLYEYGIAFDTISKEARRLFADYFFAKMYEMIGLSEWPTDKRAKK